MGCIPSQTDHQEKLAIKQHTKTANTKSGEPKEVLSSSGVQSNSVPLNIDQPKVLNNDIQREPSARIDQNLGEMDVEMTGDSEDYPAWEVQPLQLVRDGKIGRGGAGNVIKATDPSTGRVVALKVKLVFDFVQSQHRKS
jgi:hypothetical protein